MHLRLASIAAVIGLLAPGPRVLAFQLTGTVVGPDGLPVDEVDLDVNDLETGLSVTFEEDDNTGSDGRFTLEVAPGFYRILFEPPAGVPLAPHVVPRLEVAGHMTLDVTLPRGVSLAGRIIGPGGTGVADVDLDVWDRELRVKLPAPGGSDRTNGLGFYSLLVPPGTYDVQANPPLSTRLAAARVDSLPVGESDVILNYELELGFILSGRVLGAGGRPAAGIDLDLTDLKSGADAPIGEDKTDAGGRFAVVLRSGRYEVAIDAPPATRLVSTVVDEVVIEADHILDVKLAPGFLVGGRVRDPGRRPVEGANLDFIEAASGEAVPTPSDFSNVRGAYVVVVPHGTYDLIAFPPPGAAYPPDTTRAIEIAGDRQLDVTFGPPPPAPVLFPIFPNPTPGAASIPFQLPENSGPVRITIADAAGRVVRVLTLEPRAGSGSAEGLVSWNGRDRRGLIASSGVYFVRLESGGQTATRKLVVFRESRESLR